MANDPKTPLQPGDIISLREAAQILNKHKRVSLKEYCLSNVPQLEVRLDIQKSRTAEGFEKMQDQIHTVFETQREESKG